MRKTSAILSLLGPSADLFAAGVVLIEQLSALVPVDEKSPSGGLFRDVHPLRPDPHLVAPARYLKPEPSAKPTAIKPRSEQR
jgi:hypothetical protein